MWTAAAAASPCAAPLIGQALLRTGVCADKKKKVYGRPKKDEQQHNSRR